MFKICFRTFRIEISDFIFFTKKASQVRQWGGGSWDNVQMLVAYTFFIKHVCRLTVSMSPMQVHAIKYSQSIFMD